MFLLIILFGLAALGLALALYMQAEIPHKPLPPAKPAVVTVQPAAPPPPAAPATAPAPTAPPVDGGTLDLDALPDATAPAGSSQAGDAP